MNKGNRKVIIFLLALIFILTLFTKQVTDVNYEIVNSQIVLIKTYSQNIPLILLSGFITVLYIIDG